jgi:hypothetical protein
LDRLVEEVPAPTDQAPIVEFYYDFRQTKHERLRCAHCRWHNHLAGYVIKTAAGTRFLVGHDCGDKIYGADFEGLKRDYDNARDHASNLRRWRNLQAALPEFLLYLSDLQRCPAVRVYRDTKELFRSKLPRLYGALVVALTRDRGVLSVDEQHRDFDAENRAQDRYERESKDWQELTATERKNRRRYDGAKAPQPPQIPIYKKVPKPVMTLRPDHRFFSEKRLPHSELATVLKQFEMLVTDISGATLRSAVYQGRRGDRAYLPDRHLFAPTYQEVFRKVNALLDQIKAAVGDLGEFQGLLHPETLAVLAHWANEHQQILRVNLGETRRPSGGIIDAGRRIASPELLPKL